MKNTITHEQVSTWETLADAQNSRDGVEALSYYYVDSEGEFCREEEGEAVCFEAIDYDNAHDFSKLRALLREAGVDMEETELDMSRGDFSGFLYTADVARDLIHTDAALYTITLQIAK